MKNIIKNTILAAVLSLSSYTIVLADGPHNPSEKSDPDSIAEAMIYSHHHMNIQVFDSEGTLLVEGKKSNAGVMALVDQSNFITKAGDTLFFVLNENKSIPKVSLLKTK